MASNTDKRRFTLIHPYNSTAETSERLILSTGELESWVGQWLAGQHPSDSFYVEEHDGLDNSRVDLVARALYEANDQYRALPSWDDIRSSQIVQYQGIVQRLTKQAKVVVQKLDRP